MTVVLALAAAAFLAGSASAKGWWIPPQHLTWYWQLDGTVNNNEPVAAYDIDGFENGAAEVTALHAQGKHVICYIDVGTWENWRSDARKFPSSVLGKPNGWPGERWLDIRQLSILEPIMTARFQMCREKGFDAV
ncbi:MAG TPA: endo alpha-1,4 polygalactosaminidase, partial [Solirubrobacteraceae bacterium]|nr:endo alpha-1,4 polygalactosaminidase [Solirubrobacteraceae bacterium]